ncbi:MAG: alpha/beta hydrolase [Acetobacteraceae bacterium]|nr:alpha/beta hydrolase [Acetobacteraceae bacterium]
MRRALPTLAALLLLPLAARADEAAHERFFSAASIPAPTPSASLAIGFTKQYRGAVPHAAFAFAMGPDGRSAWAMVSGRATPAEAEAEVLANCNRTVANMRGQPLGAPCRLLATDLRLAEGGAPLTPASGTIGPFRRSPFHVTRGPAEASGAVIWSHGYDGPDRDLRGAPGPGFLAALNEAGYDILRFDRHPGDDALFTSLPRLVRGLPALRHAGYRRVILAGQSRGGWQALLAANERPDLVDAVIATAPAAHGEAQRSEGQAHPGALEDFQRALNGLAADRTRVAIILFEGDEFDPSPARRAETVASLAAQRTAPTLALWPRNLRGHSAIGDWRFTRDYAGCVLTFVSAPDRSAPRGLRRESCGGG